MRAKRLVSIPLAESALAAHFKPLVASSDRSPTYFSVNAWPDFNHGMLAPGFWRAERSSDYKRKATE
jgi:hypothetical protein